MKYMAAQLRSKQADSEARKVRDTQVDLYRLLLLIRSVAKVYQWSVEAEEEEKKREGVFLPFYAHLGLLCFLPESGTFSVDMFPDLFRLRIQDPGICCFGTSPTSPDLGCYARK